MKKIFCLTLALLLCMSLLAGCSKDKPQTDVPQTNASQTDAAQTGEPEVEEEEIVTTFTLENEKMIAENVSPYDGLYLEGDSAETVSGVCAVKFTNTADQTVQEAQLIFSDGTQELSFWLEMLPAGQSVIVCEQNKNSAASEQLRFVDGTVTYLADGLENAAAVKVSTAEGNLVNVENAAEGMLPLVRVFYRSSDKDGTPLGGPCSSVMVDGIESGSSATVEAENWDASSVVVTVLVINE
jgi:hypothetical protein